MNEAFDRISAQIRTLEAKLKKAIASENVAEELSLKKQLYTAKIAAIDILQQDTNDDSEMTAEELIEYVERLPKSPKYLTGVDALDAPGTLEGFESGTFVQIAGASGAGKTSLAMQILANVSKYSPCYLFSFEMGLRRSAYRLKKILGTTDQRRNLKVRLKGYDIDTVEKMIRIRSREGYRFFVIDSKMKIEHSGHAGKEHEKWSAISTKLATLCQELDIILILINQNLLIFLLISFYSYLHSLESCLQSLVAQDTLELAYTLYSFSMFINIIYVTMTKKYIDN